MVGHSEERPGAFGDGFTTIRRRDPRAPATVDQQVASPDLMPSRRRRSRHRSFRHLSRRLASPLGLAMLLCTLAAGGLYIWKLLEERRIEQRLAVVKEWPDTTVDLRPPATAALRTHLDGSFLHYELTITPRASGAGQGAMDAAVEAIEGVNFVVRLVDADGFTVMTIRPIEELTVDRTGSATVLNVKDVVGCSPQLYAAASSWTIQWAGRDLTSDASARMTLP